MTDTIEITGTGVEMPLEANTTERRARLARLASAAFFIGAIALVSPALADECTDTAEMVRDAARDDSFPGEKMHAVERALDRALGHHARGDDLACRLEITVLRRSLSVG